MNQTIDYLMTLGADEMKAAIAAMPEEERTMLAQTLCHNITRYTRQLVAAKNEIWETGELPQPDFFNRAPKVDQ